MRVRMSRLGKVAVSVLSAALLSSGLAHGQSVPNRGSTISLRQRINLSHLNFLKAEVPYPASPVQGLSTFDPGQPLAVWYTYANYNSQANQYTRVGSGTYNSSTNTWGQGESALDDIARAVIVYLKHYELFHDATSLANAVAGLRTICYLQVTNGPDAGNFYDWMQPTGEPNLTVDNASSFNWWGSRALWALAEGYGVLKTANPGEAAYLKSRIDLAMQQMARTVSPAYGHFQSLDGMNSPAWLIGDGSDASSVAVLG